MFTCKIINYYVIVSAAECRVKSTTVYYRGHGSLAKTASQPSSNDPILYNRQIPPPLPIGDRDPPLYSVSWVSKVFIPNRTSIRSVVFAQQVKHFVRRQLAYRSSSGSVVLLLLSSQPCVMKWVRCCVAASNCWCCWCWIKDGWARNVCYKTELQLTFWRLLAGTTQCGGQLQ